MDAQTEREQEVWEHYDKIESENYHLKNQLARKNREIKQLKHFIRVWKNRCEALTGNRKPRYRNNGKGGK
jgi:hypothetical protein